MIYNEQLRNSIFEVIEVRLYDEKREDCSAPTIFPSSA